MSPSDGSPREGGASEAARIIAARSDRYEAHWRGRRYECVLRGLLRKNGVEALCGDWATLDRIDDVRLTARITQILPRRTLLTRPRVANIDQAIIIHSLRAPDFSDEAVERLLAHAALSGVAPILCLSKRDLVAASEVEAIVQRYEGRLGVRVVATSIHDPLSLTPLTDLLVGKASALAGPSGAGKSSLLNALNPDLRLRVSAVSGKIGRGRHTTRQASLLEALPGAWTADTPGFSNLKFTDTPPADLARAYSDFAALGTQCAFANCLHLEEDGCAVRVQVGLSVDAERYARYVTFQAEARECAERLKRESAKEAFGAKTLDAAGRGAQRQMFRLKGRNRQASRRVGRQQAAREATESEEDALD